MTKELSALFDGELEVHEEPTLWVSMKANPRLWETWRHYKLIGDALRDEQDLSHDITGKVMRELHDEPVVLAPQPRRPARWSTAVMALAASVAGVAVVGWTALVPQSVGQETAVMARVQPPTKALAQNASVSAASMQEYMLAHQANAPGLHLLGGAQHIRTVSAVGGGK
jgi:sigma-E factor negative regulatory protein RseA